jgi:predicted dehydrogenase
MTQGNGSEPLRVGILGCGWISDWHGRAAAQAADVQLVACCDTVPEAAEAFRERHGCERSYTALETMLAEHELDAVVLATWPGDHLEQIRACLDAGIRNILCEKSLTVGSDQVLAVYDAARAAEALVVEGFMYRHHPALRKIDEILAAGDLGTIDNVSASFDFFDAEEEDPNGPRNWRQRAEAHGGVPYDLLCYAVNAANHAAGALPVQVMAFSRRSERYDTVTRVFGVIEYENGVYGTVKSSKKSDHDYELKINGSRGQLVLPIIITPDRIPPREAPEPGEYTEIYVSRTTDLFAYDTTAIKIPATDPYLRQMEDFAAAVRGEGTPEPALAESVVNVHTINALLRSGEEHTAIAVELPDAVRAELSSAVPAG